MLLSGLLPSPDFCWCRLADFCRRRTFVGAAGRVFAIVGLFRRKNTVFVSSRKKILPSSPPERKYCRLRLSREKINTVVGFREKRCHRRLPQILFVLYKICLCRRRFSRNSAVVSFYFVLLLAFQKNIAVVDACKIVLSLAFIWCCRRLSNNCAIVGFYFVPLSSFLFPLSF